MMARYTPALTTSSRGTSIRAPPVATAAPPTGFTFMFASQHEKKKFPKKLNFPQSSRSQKKIRRLQFYHGHWNGVYPPFLYQI